MALPEFASKAPWLAALILSAGVAMAARQARSLTTGGAVAAFWVGALALRAGWNVGALLLFWFITASLLSRLGRDVKGKRTASIIEKAGARDARQVLANGFVFMLGTLGMILDDSASPLLAWNYVAIGALAAAGSDTWATEIGTLYGGTPRSIRSWAPVPVGTSGAISTAGLLAMLAGAIVIACTAAYFRITPPSRLALVVVVWSGVAGALSDTLLGALIQERRWCPQCREATEQRVHACGIITTRIGGVLHLENDAVNLLCTVVGAVVALAVASTWSR